MKRQKPDKTQLHHSVTAATGSLLLMVQRIHLQIVLCPNFAIILYYMYKYHRNGGQTHTQKEHA